MTKIKKIIPLHSLIITIGGSIEERNNFCNKWFDDYEIISINDILYSLCGDKTKYEYNDYAQNLIRNMIYAKLSVGERVVINAPNISVSIRKNLTKIGFDFGIPVFYLQFGNNNDNFVDFINPSIHEPEVIQKFPDFSKWSGLSVISDVHGMLQPLLSATSWAKARNHFMIFLGDVIDYGHETLEVADEVYRLVMRGEAALILGNHERKIFRYLKSSHQTFLSEGNKITINALNALSNNQKQKWIGRFNGLINHTHHYMQIENIILAHAGIHPRFWNGDYDREIENFCLFGGFENNNRTYEWVDHIPEDYTVIVGHDIRSTLIPYKSKNAIFLDTGCGKGGHLSSVDIRFKNGPKIENMNYW